MEKTELAEGRYIEFNHFGFRIGRVVRIKGSKITVVLAPYKLRGKRKGKRVMIRKEDIKGIIWRKEVIPCEYMK